MRDRLEKMLVTLGLSDKEAKVYLASAMLGAATAQEIAAKATVNRPTTYVMIESLIGRGIMSSHTRGKKRYFTAVDADKLMILIEREERRVAEGRAKLQELIPSFNEIRAASKAADEGTVSVYEGVQAAKVWQEEVESAKGEVLEIVPVKGHSTLSLQKRNGRVRRLYLLEKGTLPPKQIAGIESRTTTAVNHPVDAEMSILVDKVAITTYAHEQKVIVLTGSRIARTFIVLFDALWQDANELT
jgi:sugar-specific transcriptional regulator TrmB